MNRKTLVSSSLIAAMAATLPATIAAAGTTVYTDSAAFSAAAGLAGYSDDYTTGFEDLSQGFVAGDYVDGDMTVNAPFNNMYSWSAGFYAWTSQVVGNLGQSGMSMTSAAGAGAMGVDVYGFSSFTSNAFDTLDYQVFDTNGVLIDSGSIASDGLNGDYFGVVSDSDLIGNVLVSGSMFGLPSTTIIDNVNVWNVPAPSGLALIAFGGIAGTRRRR